MKKVEKLDHYDLNKFIKNPTAENIAEYLIKKINDVTSEADLESITVRVWESEKSYVEATDMFMCK